MNQQKKDFIKMSKVLKKPSFHAHHSPMGSYGTLTCGMFGASGGLAVEEGSPAPGSIIAGYIDNDGIFNQLPLQGMEEDERSAYFENKDDSPNQRNIRIIHPEKIKRTYSWA